MYWHNHYYELLCSFTDNIDIIIILAQVQYVKDPKHMPIDYSII